MNLWETWFVCTRCGVEMLPSNCTKHARKCEARERERMRKLYDKGRNTADVDTTNYIATRMHPRDRDAFAHDYGDEWYERDNCSEEI